MNWQSAGDVLYWTLAFMVVFLVEFVKLPLKVKILNE